MNVSKYDFHDGCIIDIEHFDNKILISMESVEISEDELQEDIVLSKYNTITGKLHIEDIGKIHVNNQEFFGILIKNYDRGYIFSFDIDENKATLVISWETCPPKMYEQTDFISIEITADIIYWENTCIYQKLRHFMLIAKFYK